MQRLIRRASEIRKRFGASALVKEVLDKAILRPASFRIVHVMVLERDAIRSHAIEPGFEIRCLTVDEVARFSPDPTNQIGSEFVERARRGYDLCFGALRDERLASYGWYALGDVEGEHASGVALELPADAAYLYKGFTHPDFRGQRLYAACMDAALSALHPRGIDRLIALVHWSNAAAQRSCERLGYRSLGRLVVGPFGLFRVPGAARGLGVVFGADAAVARARRSRSS